jgi:hypothetical protein
MADEPVDPPHALYGGIGVRPPRRGIKHIKWKGGIKACAAQFPRRPGRHWAQNWGMNSAPLAALGETAIPQSKCDAASPPSRVCSVNSRPTEGMPSPTRRVILTIHRFVNRFTFAARRVRYMFPRDANPVQRGSFKCCCYGVRHKGQFTWTPTKDARIRILLCQQSGLWLVTTTMNYAASFGAWTRLVGAADLGTLQVTISSRDTASTP